ncbi:DNA translocase FtsK [Helicobacter sp. 11S02596-1]|uniref:FtsK/SpoIIIE family DNA translocase n=1 Tax=Helicobacter sp. 11S02596-1 TaxID=1476194 RepID=UPI00215109B6|nr:DNA translocase FtsK [Helicobacter sp. 11S02596-1]
MSIATIFGDSGLVGNFGAIFAKINIAFFGYGAYFYLLFLIYPAYLMYRNMAFTQRKIEVILAGILGFVAFLILQAIIVKKGEIGKAVVDFLQPFIGLFGICVFIFILIFLSYMMFFPKNFVFLLAGLKRFYKKISFIKTSFDSKHLLEQFLALDMQKFFPKREILQSSKPALQQDLPQDLPQDTPQNTQDDPIPVFNESKIKISYTPAPNKDNEEKKYASMVRLVDENEEGEVLEANIERILNRNKKFFEELSAKHFSDEASKPKPEAIPKDLPKEDSAFNPQKEAVSWLEKLPKKTISEVNATEKKVEKNLMKEIFRDDGLDFPKNIQTTEDGEKDKTLVFKKIFPTIQKSETPTGEEKPSPSAFKTTFSTLQTPTPKQKPLIVKELAENKQLLEALDFGEVEKPKDYQLPSTQLLEIPKSQSLQVDENEIDKKIQDLLVKLKFFKIDGDIARTYSGPIVTTFEFRPAPDVKVSRILTLGDDLAMALCAQSIRIQAPIPGKDVVGIEIPNAKSETIYLREILESDLFKNSASPLTLALGKDIVGNPFITDLKKLPHLLIAGTTGSGKSVGVNAMILSLLFRNSPDNLKLIMIDPKMVEFSMYADIPHLLTPIITNPKKAISALGSAVKEMERRYKMMSECKTKNIDKYNPKAKLEGLEVFPFLVIIIDELADLMMTGGKEAEFPIARIAQMGRAAGLHLIVATQRPSVDVVTGLIKTNLPSRISFKVGSKIDSRVVLDTEGAQSLLGRGDMLFTPPGIGGVVRLHAPWASEEEIEEIVEFIKSQREVAYDKDFLIEESDVSLPSTSNGALNESGEILDEAKRIILQDKKTSISYLQRKLGVGYNKAASIIEELQNQGFLSEPNAKGVREIMNL